MRRTILVVMLLGALVPTTHAQAPETWDADWHFRLTLRVGPSAVEPMTRAPVQVGDEGAPIVLVPVDFTSALKAAGTWPFDAAGRPYSWTFAPETVRVLGAATGAAVPARFLPYRTDALGAPYDASANAAGTLALLLPGSLASARDLVVLFDIAENPLPTMPAPSARDAARLDELGGLGPFVGTLAYLPPTPAGAKPTLQIVATTSVAPTVRVERISAGSPPELVVSASVDNAALLALPPSETGATLRIVADRPILASLSTDETARAARFHAALDGTAAGRSFLVPGDATIDLVGTVARTSISVTDARTGAAVATYTVGRLSSAPHVVPPGALHAFQASEPVLALERGRSDAQVDAFLAQGRSLQGAATGSILVGARGAGHALVASAPATAQAFPLARPQEIASARLGETGRYAWVARAAAPPASEAWAFSSPGASLTLLTGSDGISTLGGVSAQRFQIPSFASRSTDAPASAPLVGRLLAPFAQTSVVLESRASNGTLLARASETYGALSSLNAFPDDAADLLAEGTVQTIDADRPVFLSIARPGVRGVETLPGLPPELAVSDVKLDHEGALLLWRDALGRAEARGGETARASVTLANYARARGGAPLTESPALEVRSTPTARCDAAWEATLPSPRLEALESGAERAAEVFVTLPPETPAGACAEYEVVATSSVDPSVRTSARLVVQARSGFEPELRVSTAEGAASSTAVALEPGAWTQVALRLRNVGGENGTARVALSSGPGYEARVTDLDGAAIRDVALAAAEERALRLELRVGSAGEPPWDFFVQATSAADPTIRDEIVVSATPRANLTLEATPAERRFVVTPGGQAATSLSLENAGADVELRIRARSLPAGWSLESQPDRVLLRAPGVRNETGAPLHVASATLVLHAPADARVGATLPVTLALEANGATLLVPLSALVANDHNLSATTTPAILAPGGRGAAPITLTSHAAAATNVSLRAIAAPTGWNATIPGLPARILPGAESSLGLRFEAQPRVPPGEGVIRVVLLLDDGLSPPREMTVDVPAITREAPAIALNLSDRSITLADGERGRVLATVRNDGNAPADVTLTTVGGIESPAGAVRLAPGESRVIALNVTAQEGRAFVRAGDASAPLRILRATRDLHLASVQSSDVAGARVVLLNVTNAGTLASPASLARFRTEDAVLLEAPLPALAPGESTSQPILVPRSALGVTIELVHLDGALDATPANNLATLEGTAATGVAPPDDGATLPAALNVSAAPWALVALLVLAVAAVRR